MTLALGYALVVALTAWMLTPVYSQRVASRTRVCPNCGPRPEGDAKFCSNCGAELRA